MKHYMKLNPVPFENIYNGLKTIELRLNDEKRKLIKINDIIVFQHIEDKKKSISVKVIGLHHFSSFSELYSTLPLLKCGYTQENIQAAKAEDMLEYYSTEQQAKYGVLGIEFEVINKIALKQIDKTYIEECVSVIRNSFETVADEFNITKENAPKYVAFATNCERLETQLNDCLLYTSPSPRD